MRYFQPVEPKHVSRLLNHGPTVLITSKDPESDKLNIMAAAWSMPVEFSPPRIAIVVDKSTWTRQLIEKSNTFAVCVPTLALKDITYAVGSVSGRDNDKFEQYKINALKSPNLGLPIIEDGCAAWLECRLLPELSSQQNYDTFFGEVISAAADIRVFSNGHWDFNEQNRSLHTLHHLGGGNFITPGESVKASI